MGSCKMEGSRFASRFKVSDKVSAGGGGKHRIAVLLHRTNQQSPIHRSAPGSPSPSVASYGSTSSSSDLLATASSALRRLHFKSSNAYRSTARSRHPAITNIPKVTVVGSRSISTDSSATMNTSTDSANTAMTMVTLTDNGETDSPEEKNQDNAESAGARLEPDSELDGQRRRFL
ncbi:hypothetical protein U1Q18_051282 [Sarracenia purpurea var. burkii]